MPDPFLIIVAVAVALFIFVQFRTAKKRRTEAANLQEKMLPGAEIMTNYGLYGTIVSINEDTNEALIETTPGTVLRVHRQTILKVVEDETPVEDATEDVAEDTVSDATDQATTTEPEFGERINELKNDEVKKPARKSAKKGDE